MQESYGPFFTFMVLLQPFLNLKAFRSPLIVIAWKRETNNESVMQVNSMRMCKLPF